MIPLYLIMRNRLTWPLAMLRDLSRFLEIEPVLVDNASTYPPLLHWYSSCPYRVVRLAQNMGQMSPWLAKVVEADGAPLYLVSDHDLGLGDLPSDTMSRLQQGLADHPTLNKCALSLRIDDVVAMSPATELSLSVEREYLRAADIEGHHLAPTDTTFALYRKNSITSGPGFFPSLRLGSPYSCRHLFWYEDLAHLSDEERYYFATASDASSTAAVLRRHGLAPEFP